jgi:hypothetical protein
MGGDVNGAANGPANRAPMTIPTGGVPFDTGITGRPVPVEQAAATAGTPRAMLAIAALALVVAILATGRLSLDAVISHLLNR